MSCNRNDSIMRRADYYEEIKIWVDHKTTKDLVRALKAGAALSEIGAILGHAGVFTAPPAWALAILGVVLYGIAEDLSTVDEGCGVVIGAWGPKGTSNPNYVYEAQ